MSSLALQGEVTRLLVAFQSGDPEASARLLDLLYPELKRIAHFQLRRERDDPLLQTTVLVHEAYLRLVAPSRQSWENRAHFLAAAANVMRRILVDAARARNARKREGARTAVSLSDAIRLSEPQVEELLDLDTALHELEVLSPRQARVVELRYFAGLSVPEVATALGLNPRSIDRDWAAARAWLRTRLLT
jgi:RNA polymerase sigma factor (TIGR02999 family)